MQVINGVALAIFHQRLVRILSVAFWWCLLLLASLLDLELLENDLFDLDLRDLRVNHHFHHFFEDLVLVGEIGCVGVFGGLGVFQCKNSNTI